MVETTVSRRQCREVTSEQCSDTQEWVCEDDELGLETLEYGAPQAPTISQPSQVSGVLISKYQCCVVLHLLRRPLRGPSPGESAY